MCGRHWSMVPKDVQLAVWRSYRKGQCDDKRPSAAWFAAASAAIGAVALREGKAVTETQAIAAYDHGVRHDRLEPVKIQAARERRAAGRRAQGEPNINRIDEAKVDAPVAAREPLAKAPEKCWYCGQPSMYLCDAKIGLRLENVPPLLHRHFSDVDLGEGSSSLRRMIQVAETFGGKVEVLTCDAAACKRCAHARGWKRQMLAIVCGRGKSDRLSTDFCHVHAVQPVVSISATTNDRLEEARNVIRCQCRV